MATDKNDKPASETATSNAAAAPVPGMTIDAEAGYKLQIEQLSREVKRLSGELAAYKQLEAERDAMAKAAKEKKSAAVVTEPRALTPMIGNGRRMIKIGDALLPDELQGLELGKHYEYAPVA